MLYAAREATLDWWGPSSEVAAADADFSGKMATLARKTAEETPVLFFPFVWGMAKAAETGFRWRQAAMQTHRNLTRRYPEPEWRITETIRNGKTVPVRRRVVKETPFYKIEAFEAEGDGNLPKRLKIAPWSGHYGTLLRNSVETDLPEYNTTVLSFKDAGLAPKGAGRFGVDEQIDAIMDANRIVNPDIMEAICQPTVELLAAMAIMEEDGEAHVPQAIILKAGPIDISKNPTVVNQAGKAQNIPMLRRSAIHPVPRGPGIGREVYPGFLQLAAFMTMNLQRHQQAQRELFRHLVCDKPASAAEIQEFYNEYFAVLDLTAEFYLETVQTVFQENRLANGTFTYRGRPVNLSAIRRPALLTVEGEKDDVCGIGQTEAAQHLCAGIPADRKHHHLQAGAGHFGVFNGGRYRKEIVPVERAFIHAQLGRPQPRMAAARVGVIELSRVRAERAGMPRRRLI